MENKCKTCQHWKNQQAELEYSKFYGICTGAWLEFNSGRGSDVVVLDRENRQSTKHMGVQRFESQKDVVPIGSVTKSRYCFVTNEEFGCIHYLKLTK